MKLHTIYKKLVLFFLSFLIISCLHNELYYQQYFIENTTDETIQLQAFWDTNEKMSFTLKPHRRLFLDGFSQNDEPSSTPVGISTFRADSIIITLKNGKKWIDVCKNRLERWPQPCYTTRGLFNHTSYVVIKDESKISYYNHIFKFNYSDAKNAK